MLVIYEGPSPARMLEGFGVVTKGVPVEIPDERAVDLLLSKSWNEAKPPRMGKPKNKPPGEPGTGTEG